MKITTIRVHKLESGPGYNNHAVDAEAAVEDGEEPEEVFKHLSDWVEQQLRQTKECRRLFEHLQIVREQVIDAERERERLRRQIEANNKTIRLAIDHAAAGYDICRNGDAYVPRPVKGKDNA